jgi:hypothetical protein
MRRLFILGAIFIFLCGCASIAVDPESGLVEYKRTGNQELHGIVIEFIKGADGSIRVKALLGDQKSEREVAEIFLAFSANLDKALQILMNIESRIP